MAYKAIDPGTRRLGWATWGRGNKTPLTGFEDLRGASEGATYSQARKILEYFIQPGDIIALEGLILVSSSSIQSRFAMFGVRALVFMVAHEVGARVETVAITQWRAWALGMGQAPKSVIGSSARRKWLKKRAVDEVEARGWGKVTDDEAEAMLMLCWLRAQNDMRYALRTRPVLPLPFGGKPA